MLKSIKGASPIYLFIESLSQSIELVTVQWEQEADSPLMVKGINLKFALQRQLYWEFLNNDTLFKLCEAKSHGQPAPKYIKVDGQREYEMARAFCQVLGCSCQIQIRKTTLGPVRGLRTALRKWLGALKNAPEVRNHQSAAPGSVEILFYIYHPRFVDFLLPIVSRLERPFAFLNPDLEVQKRLSQEKLPWISLAPSDHISNEGRYLGHLAAWCETYLKWLGDLRPKSLVLVEGCASADEVLNRVARKLGIKTFCIQQGWDACVQVGFRNTTFDKLLVWGRGFQDALLPYNPAQKFASVGNFHINLSTANSKGSFEKSIGFLLQSIARLIPVESWNRMLNLVGWAAERFPDREILVREHPRHPLNKQQREHLSRSANIRWLPSQTCKLDDFFKKCRISVIMCSSTIFESIAAGVPPVIFNDSRLPFVPDLESRHAALFGNTFEETQAKIEAAMTNDELYADIVKGCIKFTRECFEQRTRDEVVDAVIQEISS
jgi:hypothetical protein